MVTTEELRHVADTAESARRIRELRTEEGYAVATMFTGRPDLRMGEYIMLRADRVAEPHDRHLSIEVQQGVFRRDDNRCRLCRWDVTKWTAKDPRILELHHLREHAERGSNERENLIVTCGRYHDKLHVPRAGLVTSDSDPHGLRPDSDPHVDAGLRPRQDVRVLPRPARRPAWPAARSTGTEHGRHPRTAARFLPLPRRHRRQPRPPSSVEDRAGIELRYRKRRAMNRTWTYPPALLPEKVGTYPPGTRSGGGLVWDAVLEYRVWCHPEHGSPDAEAGSDYFRAFATFDQASAFSSTTPGAEKPLALVLQEEYIDEPSPGSFVHVRKRRITEWPVELLQRPKRRKRTIPDFLSPHGPTNGLDILRGLAPPQRRRRGRGRSVP